MSDIPLYDGTWFSSKPKPVKKCPECPTGQLVVRTNADTQEQFLGCTNWMSAAPCKHTESLPIDILLRAQGAPTLPGLD